MSVQQIRKEFRREAELIRKAISCGSMSAADGKKAMHAVLNDLVQEEDRRLARREAQMAHFDLEKEYTEFWVSRLTAEEEEGK